MIGEFVGGILANSLAILTDATHLLSDLTGFGISIFSIWVGKKGANNTMSYGYHRAEVIGALASIVLVWFLTGGLLYEAVRRIYNPLEVDPQIMLITSFIGLIFNLIMGKILHSNLGGHHHHGHSNGKSDCNSHSHKH